MSSRRLLTILLAGMSVSACTEFKHYRTKTLAASANVSQPKIFECNVESSATGNLCEDPDSADSHAIQHRRYRARYREADEKTGKVEWQEIEGTTSYYLSFVEFDDQGWFVDRKQMDALLLLLENLEQKNNSHTLIYVYAHGWKHNASPCDNNVLCFSRLLERTDLAEHILHPGETDGTETNRTVVGVYLGWRGLPNKAGALTSFSFWSRMRAAARVGRGSVLELLVRLKDYRDNRQEDAKDANGERTQLVITGHSFGGLIIYSALSHALMERAAKTTKDPGTGEIDYDVAKSFGDLVILVNPAFQGSLYEPLFHITTNRCYDEGRQRPVMMIVTSKTDSATGRAFPIGRRLGTLFQNARSPEQSRSMRTAIGHDKRYETHRLTSTAEDQEPEDDGDCGCPYLELTSEWDIKEQVIDLLDPVFAGEPAQRYGTEVELVHGSSETESSPKYPPGYPYLVVSADSAVIPDHNAIYNDRFINFTQLFSLHHIGSNFTPLFGDSDSHCAEEPQAPSVSGGRQDDG